MSDFDNRCINLNIWYYLPESVWDSVRTVYQAMPGWQGFDKRGFPYWFGTEKDEKWISTSIEPSGLQILGRMEVQEWNEWTERFKEIASQTLGFAVGEPEDGFE